MSSSPASDPNGPGLPAGVELRRRPPTSRARFPQPAWNVWLGDQVIGYIEQWTVRSSSATFFNATGIESGTGNLIRLDSNTDLVERVEKVVAAWHNPEQFTLRR